MTPLINKMSLSEYKTVIKIIKLYFKNLHLYSAIKRNEIVPLAETWMGLETVIQSEVSQKEKNKHSILTHICGI